jgi:hypothetical protein
MSKAVLAKAGDTLILPSGRVKIHLVAQGAVDISPDRNVSPLLLSDLAPAHNQQNTWIFVGHADAASKCSEPGCNDQPTVVRELIDAGFSVPWRLCEYHAKQFDGLPDALLGSE